TAVREALERYRPDLVQIEHAELLALSELRSDAQRWVLSLHDAIDEHSVGDAMERSAFRRALERFDAVVACSAEDARLVDHPRVVEIGNGAHFPPDGYHPSCGTQLLFLGPFRYARHLDGLRRCLS